MKKYSLYFLLFNLVVLASCGKQKGLNEVNKEIENTTENVIPQSGSVENEIQKTTITTSNVVVDSIDQIKEISQDIVSEQDTDSKLESSMEENAVITDKVDNAEKIIEEVEVTSKIEKHEEEQLIEKTAAIKKDVEEKISKKNNVEIKTKALDHKLFDTFLRKYVSSAGDVNYKMMKSHQIELESYINLLQNNFLDNNWTRNEKLAYWINAYNAFTLKLILDNYPIASITDIAGGKPWDKKWIALGGKVYSLNQIENDIIRPQFKEPRIHFAVNCAAQSCPKLGNFAYTASNLNNKLTSQTKAFINSSENEINTEHLKISKIFEWYKSDFGELISFFNTYSTTKINANASIEYNEYNWSLNGK